MRATKRILISLLLICMLVSGVLAACSDQPPKLSPVNSTGKELMVFAGAASKPPLDEAARLFEKQTGIRVFINYGGSGTVLSQMKLSQTGDLYIPGSPDYLIKAETEQVIEPDSGRIISYLLPVIGVQHGNPMNIDSLDDLAKPDIEVGIGNPEAVCVGLYAVELLDYNHLLEEVYGNIVTQADSCEKTATLLSLKSVDAVIGWHVFHDWDPANIDVIYLKPEQIPRIAYVPAAVSRYSKNKESARAFLDFLIAEEAQNIFRKWGYLASEQEVRKFAPDAAIGGEYSLPENYKALKQ